MIASKITLLSRSVLVLLFFSIALPTVFQDLKLLLLSLIVAFILINSGGTLKLNPRIFLASIAIAVLGFFWSVYGFTLGNPGALRVLTVMVLYPVLFPFIYSVLNDSACEKIPFVFFLAAAFISVFDFLLVGSSFFEPLSFFREFASSIDESTNFSESDEYFKFTAPNIASIIFLLPFFFSALAFGFRPLRKHVIAMVVLLLFSLAVFSGRRALLVTMFLGPLIAWILSFKLTRSRIRSLTIKIRPSSFLLSFILLICFVVLLFGLVNVVGKSYLVGQLSSIFEFSEDDSNVERTFQFRALMQGISESPFFGSGAGAAASYPRSSDQPWAYELFYVSLVFQYGVFGFLVYLIPVLYVVFWLVKRVKSYGRDTFYFCYLSGLISFLISSGTNPYIAKFDYMWVIFIPYVLINNSLICRESLTHKRI